MIVPTPEQREHIEILLRHIEIYGRRPEPHHCGRCGVITGCHGHYILHPCEPGADARTLERRFLAFRDSVI